MQEENNNVYLFQKSGGTDYLFDPKYNFLNIKIFGWNGVDSVVEDLRTRKGSRWRKVIKDRTDSIIIFNLDDLLEDLPELSNPNKLEMWIQNYRKIIASKFKTIPKSNILFFGDPFFYDLDLHQKVKKVTRNMSRNKVIIPARIYYSALHNFLIRKKLHFRNSKFSVKNWINCRTTLQWFLSNCRYDQGYYDGYIYALSISLCKIRKVQFEEIRFPLL